MTQHTKGKWEVQENKTSIFIKNPAGNFKTEKEASEAYNKKLSTL